MAVALFRGNVIDLDFAVMNVAVSHSVIAYVDVFDFSDIWQDCQMSLERRLTFGKERNRASC